LNKPAASIREFFFVFMSYTQKKKIRISVFIFLALRLLFYRSEHMPGPTDSTRYRQTNQKRNWHWH
jgi:hypothetical protein